MARERFSEDRQYVARLSRVVARPIENRAECGFQLIRLEFEVFLRRDEQQAVASTGKIACRDLVIGKAVDVLRDSSLASYAKALGLREPARVSNWFDFANRKPPDRRPWVTIVFGSLNPLDQRNSFQKIAPFDITGWQIIEYDYDLDMDWVRVSVAADQLECSAATIRRRVAELEPQWGPQLVTRTTGRQRRIHLPLLRRILSNGPERSRSFS